MKKIVWMILVIVIFFAGTKVSAICYDDELNNWAEKLEIKLIEVNDKYTPPGDLKRDDIPYSYLLLLNSPRKDIKVTARDTYSGGSYNVAFDEDYNNFVVGSEIHFVNKTYTFTIYMSGKANKCANEKMKTIEYIVPKYNEKIDTIYCEDNPDDEICGAYVEVNEDKVDKIITNYYEKDIKKDKYGVPWYIVGFNAVKEHYLYVLVPLIIMSIFYKTMIMFARKKSGRK